jgi:hypothetical protein
MEQLTANYKKKEQEMMEFQRAYKIQVQGESPIFRDEKDRKDSSETTGGVLV